MENQFYNAFDQESLEPDPPRDASAVPREPDYRNAFEINRDRIIHTSAFRRLQSKTQVFLSGEYDFYRTRLTHSIEVSQIGRSICTALRRRSPHLGPEFYIDADLVEAACLAHDIGHPPFGHAGERTLHRLMKPWGGFEGNAQTLRMLTRTIFSGSGRGMNPCRAFLDATLKYKTLFGELTDPENHFLYDSQHVYLDWALGGQDFPAELTPGKSRDLAKSIECQIMDWADDTAYSLNDIADGYNAGFLTLEALERWAASRTLDDTESRVMEKLLGSIRNQRLEVMLRARIGDFINACTLVPDVNFMTGWTRRYAWRLEVTDEARKEAALYKKMALHLVFRSRQLQQLEHKSDNILTQLMNALLERYVTGRPGSGFRLLRESEEAALEKETDEAARARLVCDAVARMTDGAATRLYRRLFDAEFRSITDLG
ncbi:MAG: deoxyguanosinetriphosphate triphosphohydrolase [Verrucomicrobiales bacterium]|nr:deoxyguanosinetriphosphate triphosphohydrolase [Verrucomicrobiales bacterium]